MSYVLNLQVYIIIIVPVNELFDFNVLSTTQGCLRKKIIGVQVNDKLFSW